MRQRGRSLWLQPATMPNVPSPHIAASHFKPRPRRGLAFRRFQIRLSITAAAIGLVAIAGEMWHKWPQPWSAIWDFAPEALSLGAVMLMMLISLAATRANEHWVAERVRELDVFANVVEASPVVIGRWNMRDPAAPVVEYMSPNIARFGYTAEEFVDGSLDFRTLIHPEDRARLETGIVDAARRGESGTHAAFRIVRTDGSTMWIEGEMTFDRAAPDGVLRAQGTLQDVTERKAAADALEYRDRVVHSVSVGATNLISAPTFQAGLGRALETIGEALGVDRVVVLSMQEEGAPSLVCLWEQPGIQTPFDPERVARLNPDMGELVRWSAPLRDGKAVVTHHRLATGAVKALLEAIGDRSLLRIPVFVGGTFWGHLGIDSCTRERHWTRVEIDTVTTFAELIGALLQRENMQRSLQRSEERFRSVSETAQDAIIMTTRDGVISFWNPSAERIFGYTTSEAIGKELHECIAPPRFRDDARRAMDEFAQAGFENQVGRTVEFTAIRKDGVEIPVEVSLASLRLGGDIGSIGIVRDISERKRAEAQILAMARVDALTGLANRRVFAEATEQAIARTKRGDPAFAVLYLDLDHFKDVNDTFGHLVGDGLLKSVADRLVANVRETDTVARFGGDEFAVLLTDIREPAEAGTVATKILDVLSAPYVVNGVAIRSGASIGIAIDPDASGPEAILGSADVALYRAKNEGRGAYRFFTKEMDASVRERMTLEADLRRALDDDGLSLLYRPRVNLDAHAIVAMEAQLAWNHPSRGLLSAEQIDAVIERTGLAAPVALWAVRRSCRDLKHWLDAGVAPIVVAVKLDSIQLKSALDIVSVILDAIHDHDLPPQLVEIELPERAAMQVIGGGSNALERLRAEGVTVALDDFGHGPVSLEALGAQAVNRIIVSARFTSDSATNEAHAAIVRGAIALGRELGIDVVVDGVDDTATLGLVRGWHCTTAQGDCLGVLISSQQAPAALSIVAQTA